MIQRIVLFLVVLLNAGCTAARPVAPATPTAGASPLPTVTLAPTSTATLVPTIASTLTPASLPAGKEITFDETGGGKLSGTLYGEGKTAIILANMSVGGDKQWNPFVAAVDKQKFTTLTFNYRSINDIASDMELILGKLKEEGFARAVCIGASVGTRACSTLALAPEIVGMVWIAGAVNHAKEATYPKLFIAGALDQRAFDIQIGYEQAAEPKELVLFEDNPAHGTDLFSSKDGEQFLTLLLDFVNELVAP
jgi:hypothetical protein